MRTTDDIASLLFVCLLGVSVVSFVVWTTPAKSDKPKFHAGQCVQWPTQDDVEPWESSQMYRIEMVGKRHYLLRKIPASLYRTQEGQTWAFDYVQQHYAPVACATGG